MRFNNFPISTFYYNNTPYNITDLSVVVKILDQFDNPRMYEYYRVGSGEKIEDVSYKYYGNVNKAYLIAMINNIIDPIYDWYMSEEMLMDYCFRKYTKKGFYTPPRKIENLQMDWYRGTDWFKGGMTPSDIPEELDNRLGVMLCAINQIHHYEDNTGEWGDTLMCTTEKRIYSRYDGTNSHDGDISHFGMKIVTVDDPNCSLTPVTNYDYEYRLNQEKQIIRLLKTEFVPNFETQYYGLLSQIRQEG